MEENQKGHTNIRSCSKPADTIHCHAKRSLQGMSFHNSRILVTVTNGLSEDKSFKLP